jgi:hypothetical protein
MRSRTGRSRRVRRSKKGIGSWLSRFISREKLTDLERFLQPTGPALSWPLESKRHITAYDEIGQVCVAPGGCLFKGDVMTTIRVRPVGKRRGESWCARTLRTTASPPSRHTIPRIAKAEFPPQQSLQDCGLLSQIRNPSHALAGNCNQPGDSPESQGPLR